MTTGLQERITAAEQATQRVIELDRLRSEADALPGLLAEEQRQQHERANAAQLLAAQEATRERLAELAPEVADWRQRFEALVADCEQLVNTLPALQGRIYAAAGGLRAACGAAQIPSTGIGDPPVEMQDGGGFAQAWLVAGGGNADLAAFPSDAEGLAAILKREVGRRARVAAYDPLHGAGAFVNRR